jgi:hypothetical protein
MVFLQWFQLLPTVDLDVFFVHPDPWLEWKSTDKIWVGSGNPCTNKDMEIFYAATTIALGIGGATTGSSMGSRPGSILGKKKTAKQVTIRCHARCPASILSPSLSLTRTEPSRARPKSISTGGLKTVLKMRPAR